MRLGANTSPRFCLRSCADPTKLKPILLVRERATRSSLPKHVNTRLEELFCAGPVHYRSPDLVARADILQIGCCAACLYERADEPTQERTNPGNIHSLKDHACCFSALRPERCDRSFLAIRRGHCGPPTGLNLKLLEAKGVFAVRGQYTG